MSPPLSPQSSLEHVSQLVQVSILTLGKAYQEHGAQLPAAVRDALEAAVAALKNTARAEWMSHHEPMVGYFMDLRQAVIERDPPSMASGRDRLVAALDALESPTEGNLKARNRLVGMPVSDYTVQFLVNLEFLIFGGRVSPPPAPRLSSRTSGE